MNWQDFTHLSNIYMQEKQGTNAGRSIRDMMREFSSPMSYVMHHAPMTVCFAWTERLLLKSILTLAGQRQHRSCVFVCVREMVCWYFFNAAAWHKIMCAWTESRVAVTWSFDRSYFKGHSLSQIYVKPFPHLHNSPHSAPLTHAFLQHIHSFPFYSLTLKLNSHFATIHKHFCL